MPSLLRLCLLALLFAGCDETSSKVRYDYVERHRESFVYEGTTRPYVIGPLRELLAERGYTLVEAPEATTLRTEKRAVGKRTEEYVVHFVDLRWRQGFVVHLIHIKREADGTVASSYRDDATEWELIQRADPDRALEILSKANERADQVAPRAERQ